MSTSQITALNRMKASILASTLLHRAHPFENPSICRASPWRTALWERQPAEDMQDETLLKGAAIMAVNPRKAATPMSRTAFATAEGELTL